MVEISAESNRLVAGRKRKKERPIPFSLKLHQKEQSSVALKCDKKNRTVTNINIDVKFQTQQLTRWRRQPAAFFDVALMK